MKLTINTFRRSQALFVFCFLAVGIALGIPQGQSSLITAPANSHPGNAIDYSLSARLKIASRKDSYSLGELMSIDLAILNGSKQALFLLSDLSPKFRASSQSGQTIHVTPYGIIEKTIDPSSFTLTEPDDFIVKSSIILIGCDKQSFEDRANKSNLEVFDQDQFVNRGGACMDVRRPGTYYVTAKITNDRVVVSSDPNLKTPVGSITSNPLKIFITK